MKFVQAHHGIQREQSRLDGTAPLPRAVAHGKNLAGEPQLGAVQPVDIL
ncbi:hypothetical protein [Streptomyces sp. NPDC049949]